MAAEVQLVCNCRHFLFEYTLNERCFLFSRMSRTAQIHYLLFLASMIYRTHYIEPVREFYDSDLIKIITGIRRSGKSVILEQIMEKIRKKSNNVIYLNFEDKRVSMNITDADALIAYVEQQRKKGTCYLFFDEIQNLDGWQDACKTLRHY